MRKLLGIGYEDATIEGRAFTAPLVEGLGRDGSPREEHVENST